MRPSFRAIRFSSNQSPNPLLCKDNKAKLLTIFLPISKRFFSRDTEISSISSSPAIRNPCLHLQFIIASARPSAVERWIHLFTPPVPCGSNSLSGITLDFIDIAFSIFSISSCFLIRSCMTLFKILAESTPSHTEIIGKTSFLYSY